MNKKEFCLVDKTVMQDLLGEAQRVFQDECMGQRRLSEAEVEMDRRSWASRISDVVLNETNQQLKSQILELHHANQWADQAEREKK